MLAMLAGHAAGVNPRFDWCRVTFKSGKERAIKSGKVQQTGQSSRTVGLVLGLECGCGSRCGRWDVGKGGNTGNAAVAATAPLDRGLGGTERREPPAYGYCHIMRFHRPFSPVQTRPTWAYPAPEMPALACSVLPGLGRGDFGLLVI